MGTEEKR